MRFLVMCVVSLSLLQVAQAGQKPVTVDDMLAYFASPGPTPVWSPDGKSFAYETDGTIYRYDIRHRKAKQWLQLSALESGAAAVPEPKQFSWRNRRVVDQKLQWFPNGVDLLVCLKGELFVLHPNGEHERISGPTLRAEAPLLSPDGSAVLYRTAHNLYVFDLETKASWQLTSNGTPTLLNGELDWVYPEELELHQAAWWSPNSKRIAYLQFDIAAEVEYPQTYLLGRRAVFEPERYPQAGTPNAKVQLGVASAKGGTTVWMQAGNSADTLLARVAWFPDSSAVALEVAPRLQNKLDLLSCDPVTGTAKVILHEESNDWINIADNLYFMKSRPEFLWTSERSGFRHVYRYSNDGKMIAQLTQGDWEIKEVQAVDESAKRVFFTASEESPLETQLYSVALAGGPPARLTAAGFDHEIRASIGGHFFLDTFSSLGKAPQCVLRSESGEQVAGLKTVADAAGDFNLHAPEIMSFSGRDGTLFYGKLTRPAGFDPSRRWPLVVHVYGGPGVQQVRNSWTGIDWDQVLAERGYLVWEMDNRGSTGRGHRFEAPVFRNLGQQEVADQRAGVEFLLSKGFVDPKRVGITGWSYGGFMTIHSMLLLPDLFKVGVAGAPVTDWRNYDSIYTERYMGLPKDSADAYDDASNVENAAELAGDLLIVHNIEDDNVLFQNTMQFVNALEEENKRYSLAIYGQKTHHVAGKVQKQMYEAMTGFFDRNLK